MPPNNSHRNSPSPPDTPASNTMVVKTKLQLVDLAGSECVGMFVYPIYYVRSYLILSNVYEV